ncbi:MAG TPA: GtrA family protein [Micropepsaceae bacterium]|nr:GtrA family protein [Micropepsaceae bacterium]
MQRPLVLCALYAIFAGCAILVNLFTQWVDLALYRGPFALPIAMACGTATGLLVKYLLDKLWIFRHRRFGVGVQMREFTGYALTGVVTTALFWGCELMCNAIAPEWRFAGAALGLTAGYVLKYRLDRHFVFGAAA